MKLLYILLYMLIYRCLNMHFHRFLSNLNRIRYMYFGMNCRHKILYKYLCIHHYILRMNVFWMNLYM